MAVNVTVTDELLIGAEYDGVFHKAFELAAATVRMEIDALDNMALAGEKSQTQATLNAYMLAEQLLSLGDIPSDAITVDIIMNLASEDLDVLVLAQDAVKKKRQDLSKPAASTES